MKLRVILAAGLLTAVTVTAAACGGSSSSSSLPSGSGGSGTVSGAGSTFQAPIVVQWSGEFQKAYGSQVNYQAIGSGGGITQFENKVVDFGGTDAPLSDADQATAQKAGGTVLHIPIVLGSVVVAYNLAGVNGLRLDGPTLADIYLGKITKWNDPAITALNPGVKLPGDDIKVVQRSDSSGTSYIYTGYLSAVSPTWSSQVGQDKQPKWPVGVGGQGNDGVAQLVQQTPGSIGYVELAYAMQNKMAYATMKNASGEWIKPSLDSTTAAGNGVTYPDDLRFSLLNSKAPGAYPIVSATWQLVWQDPSKAGINAATAKNLVKFLTYELATGQSEAASLDYAPLPKDLQKLAIKAVDTIVIPSS